MPSAKDNIYVFSREKLTTFNIQKSGHFAKIKTISVTFLYTKIQTLLITRFFMKLLKMTFIHKNHSTFRYVTFLYTKVRHFAKSKTICVPFLYTKTRKLCVTGFFIECLKKTMHFALHFFINKYARCVTFLYLEFIV